MLQTLDQYASASFSQKVEIANRLFADRFQEFLDTLYVFDHHTDPVYLDAMVYYNAALNAYEVTQDYPHAALWCQRSEAISEQCDTTFIYGDCLALASCIYIRLSDFTQAIEYAEKSLQFDRVSNDPAKISSSLNNAAAIYVCANRPEEAEKYMVEAVKTERTIGRPKVLSSRLGLAAETFVQLGKYNDAYDYAKEALEIAQKEDNSNRIAMRKSQFGLALFHLNRYDEARTIMLEAIDTLTHYNNRNSLSITYRQLSSLEQRVGNDAQAIDYLKHSLDISRQLGNKMHIGKECRQLADLIFPHDPTQAYQYLLECFKINEEIYDDQMTNQLQSFSVRYETAEMKHQLEKQKHQLHFHRVMIVIAVLVLLILLFAVVTLLRLAKARGKTNKILQQASAAKDELLRIANAEKLQAESARQQILEVADHISALSTISDTDLTSREVQIIRLYSQGLMSKEVAEQLNISVRTVESHKNHIYRKLGISTTVELLRFAQQKGIV